MNVDYKLLVVIPVRGGSKGIPRKNVRLLNGAPLLSYTIQTALRLKNDYIVDVVVDTDDEEIAEISRQYGVKVVLRPEELARDNITLDPVIFHAVNEMEKKRSIVYTAVITMQATSPTLKYNTLRDAIEYFKKNSCDTLISGVNDPRLSWTYSGDVLVPKYEKRANRQFLPADIKETGGFLITKRENISENSRIGCKVEVYEIPKQEAIDIDNYYEWKLCETILKAKRILLRADGEESLGMGHIYRVLSLAYHLTGHDILFVTKDSMRLGKKKLQDSYFPVRTINSEDEIYSIVREYKPDIFVNDILDTSKEYIKNLKAMVSRVVNFEDKGDGACYADAVINALYDGENYANVYNGFKYFFIRDEFLTARPKIFSEKVQNIVVLFGGSDPSDLTRKTYSILQQVSEDFPDISFHIITGFGYKYKNLINDDKMHHIFIHNDVKRVSKYLADADLAITSQGRTIFELACMGVPSIVMAQNIRESEHVFAGFANGFINIGLGREQDDYTIFSTIEWLIRMSSVRKEMHDILLEKDFLAGQDRVIRIILGE